MMRQRRLPPMKAPEDRHARAKQDHTLPGWARKLVAEERGPTPAFMIDHVVNIHAGVKFRAGEMAAMNMTHFVRRWARDMNRRELISALWELAWRPGCAISPARRSSFARKWARRLERGAP